MSDAKRGITGFRQIRLFSLFGFEVKLDLSWLLLGLLIGWSLGAGMYPAEYPGLTNTAYAWMGVAGAIGVFFSIVFHEFSHSLVARHFGMPIRGITLFIFGGVAEMEEEPPSAKSEFLMAVAGPIASFVLSFIFARIAGIAELRDWPAPIAGVCGSLACINMIVAIFNLVPAFPLDGGRMLRAALWQWKKDVRWATRISSQMGSGFGFALMLLGVVAFIQGNIIGGMWWFLIGIFLRGAAASSYQRLLFQEMLHEKPVTEFMRPDPVTVPSSISVRELVEDYVYRHHFKMFPVVDGDVLLGSVGIENIRQLPRERWTVTTVRDVMEPCSEDNTVAADMQAEKLLNLLIRPAKQSRYLVVDSDRLVGIISLRDVMELLALKLDIESPG